MEYITSLQTPLDQLGDTIHYFIASLGISDAQAWGLAVVVIIVTSLLGLVRFRRQPFDWYEHHDLSKPTQAGRRNKWH